MKYTLPIDPDEIKAVRENDVIDMASLNFPATVTDPQRVALMYIRNIGVKAAFSFERCSYEEKENYLLLFMTTKRMSVNIPILASTWAYILLNDSESKLQSILTFDEAELFRKTHSELVQELYTFLVSIPLCAMDIYATTRHEERIDMRDFKVSSYVGFNHFALIQLLDYNEIILLSQTIEGTEPLFYTNYFASNKCDVYPGFVGDMINRFPHLQLINIIMNNDPKLTSMFIDGVNKAIVCTDKD